MKKPEKCNLLPYIFTKSKIYKDFNNNDISLGGDILFFTSCDIKKGEKLFYYWWYLLQYINK